MNYVGIDIGGTKCAVVLADENADILKKVSFDTIKGNWRPNLERIFAAIRSFDGKFCAIGISCGGPLDSEHGIILSPPNLMGWDNVEIVKLLQEEFHVPAFLQNDANACALAEWKFGAGKGCRNMIFLTFGTGMGAGFILNGALYEGTCGMAGEAGHIKLSEYGPVGYGIAGSFEGFCSGGGIVQLAKMMLSEQLQMGKTDLFCTNFEELTAKSVAEAARKGDALALRIYKVCGQFLGRALSILIDVLNPERIVIGSIYSRSRELLEADMWKSLRELCLPQSLEVCNIVPAALGEAIGDIAAVSVSMVGLEGKI